MSTEVPLDHADRVRRALGGLGLAGSGLSFLAKGANNVVYALEASGRPLVAKVGVNPASRHLDMEWDFLRSHPGIGPECLAFATGSDGSQLILQERLAGEHPFALDAEGLEALGRLLRRYHRLSAPSGTPAEDWRSFMQRRILATPAGGPQPALAQELAAALREATALGEREGDGPAGPLVPVHGDLIPLNILRQGPSSFRIIDWEGLRQDEPEADVATLFKAYRCGAAQQQAFERGYGPGLRPQRLRFRRLLHDLQVAAWRLACQIPQAQGLELEKALRECREELDDARRALAEAA